MGIAGDYYLEFRLRIMPRRGAEREEQGRLWGARNLTGPVQRVQLGAGEASHRLLIQSGTRQAVWRTGEAGGTEAISSAELLAPIIPGTDLTPFDLQMPYLYWEDFVFEGVSRIRSRPAHTFLLYPPEDFAGDEGALHGVRIYLDTQFNALVQSELIDASGKAYKTMTVLDLRKTGEQWMVKTIDLRDERTRNKTRFQVTGVALQQDFSPAIFEVEYLSEPVAAPAQVTAL